MQLELRTTLRPTAVAVDSGVTHPLNCQREDNEMFLTTATFIFLSLQAKQRLTDPSFKWLRKGFYVDCAAVGDALCITEGGTEDYEPGDLIIKNGKVVRHMKNLGEYYVGGLDGLLYYSAGGHIYVVNQKDKEMRRFGSFGKGASHFTRGGQSNSLEDMDGPQQLAAGARGDVFAYDQGSGTIKHFNAKGAFQALVANDILKHCKVRGMCCDASDHLYLTCTGDQGEAFAALLSSSGKLIRKFGSAGEGVGQFHIDNDGLAEPTCIAVGPDGTVYVADLFGGEIEIFDPMGKAVKTLIVGDQNSYSAIYSLSIDKRGILYGAGDRGVFMRKPR